MSDDASFTLTLINKVTKPARAATKALDGIDKTLRRVKNAADSSFFGKRGQADVSRFSAMQGGIMRQFQGMGQQLNGHIASGVSKLGTGLAVAAASAGVLGGVVGAGLLKGADFAQRSMMGFTALLKDGPAARAMFDDTRAMAQRLGLDVYATTQAMTRFTSLGFKSPMANDLIKAGADLQMFGVTAEGVNNIFAQIGQMQAKGKLQGEELMVLAENGVDLKKIYASLGKTLGKTTDEIIKMQGTGQLTSDMAFPAILAAIQEMTGTAKLGDAAENAAKSTLGGIKGTLVAGWQNMMTELGEASAPGLMAAFRDISTVLQDAMGDESLRSGILDTVTAIAQGVRDAIPAVKAFVGGFVNGFSAAWPAIEGALGMIMGLDSNGGAATRALAFGEALGKVVAFAVGVVAAIGGLILLLSEIGAAFASTGSWIVDGIGAAVFAIDDFVLNARAGFNRFVADAGMIATNFMLGLVNGIKGGAQWVITAISNLGGAMIDAIKRKLGIFSPSRVMEKMGLFTGAGFQVGIVGSVSGIEKASAQLADAAIPVAPMGVRGPTVTPPVNAPSLNGAASSSVGSIVLNVTAAPGATREDGQRFGEGMAPIIQREIRAYFEGESLGGAY